LPVVKREVEEVSPRNEIFLSCTSRYFLKLLLRYYNSINARNSVGEPGIILVGNLFFFLEMVTMHGIVRDHLSDFHLSIERSGNNHSVGAVFLQRLTVQSLHKNSETYREKETVYE
jgi:hypothetical protein